MCGQKVWGIENGDKLICSLCTDIITARTYNIERHFSSKHKDVSEMANEDKSECIAKRVLNFGKQNKFLKSFVTSNNHATSASYVAALSIGTNGKPFTDGEFLKNPFLNCSEHLFNDFANKKQIIERIKEMPLSARTVQRRVEDMAKNIDEQVKNDLVSCDIISIAVDESTDINSIGRLAIIIRFASINSSNVNEELCVLASMNETTKALIFFVKVQEFTNLKKMGKYWI
ncbi:zinc finger BED domain-containing protein 5-like [Stegodyphus dumicola]|uniref:zinc finger BED domain-containing protein 5-like n=1 Tax=Stegodyphus dumicola TaxID=202533 RepID=UPI0015AA7D07|nr:zinc finger BED domain-containing protein 5-like [Stegodyphus dumicola]